VQSVSPVHPGRPGGHPAAGKTAQTTFNLTGSKRSSLGGRRESQRIDGKPIGSMMTFHHPPILGDSRTKKPGDSVVGQR